MRLDADDLSPTLLASQTFHLICNPTRAQSMVSRILLRRQEQGITQRPMFLWEPVPGVCTTDDWKDCIDAMKVVDVISPNVNEAAGFLGRTVDEDQPFEQFRGCVEMLAKEYTSRQIRKSGAAVFRCGKHGCLVATPSMMKWLPAYHRGSAARTAVPLVEDQGDVDIDDVTLAQRLVARNAMADHMVDRGAGRLAVTAIHQGRRQRAAVHAEFEYPAVDVLRRHARFDFTDQHVETFGREPPGLAHALESLRAVNFDLPGFAQRRTGCIDISHGVSGIS